MYPTKYWVLNFVQSFLYFCVNQNPCLGRIKNEEYGLEHLIDRIYRERTHERTNASEDEHICVSILRCKIEDKNKHQNHHWSHVKQECWNWKGICVKHFTMLIYVICMWSDTEDLHTRLSCHIHNFLNGWDGPFLWCMNDNYDRASNAHDTTQNPKLVQLLLQDKVSQYSTVTYHLSCQDIVIKCFEWRLNAFLTWQLYLMHQGV